MSKFDSGTRELSATPLGSTTCSMASIIGPPSPPTPRPFKPKSTHRVYNVDTPKPKNGFDSVENGTINGLALPHSVSSSTTKEESWKRFLAQACIPFVLAGCGMVAAGVLLDRASSWLFLSKVPEALILVPALLGLKGNLEMTLASRISTMANLGHLDTPRQQLVALYSNVALDQSQAIVVSLVASMMAVGAHLLEGNQFDFPRAFCVILSGTMTASVTSFALASLMVLLTISARRFGLNPDNIATPMAAAIGDVTSLAFLIIFGTWFYQMRNDHLIALIILFSVLISSVLFWMCVAARVPLTREVLKFGWFAVLAAMMISSSGGYVLQHTIEKFPGIGLFQPVINGVGGNLVAVQASKISTYLHRFGKKGHLPANRLITYANPLRTFSCKERESNNAVILLAMSVPGHLLFIGLLLLTGEMGSESLNLPFLSIYLGAAIVQVALLLFICQLLCRALWQHYWDPDTNAIPLLTSLGDLFGTCLLALAFFIHFWLFPEYSVGEVDGKMDAVTASTDAVPSTMAVLMMNSTLTAIS